MSMADPLETPAPSPMYTCECGQSIYTQPGDDDLVCYECGREYHPLANELEIEHVLCPWCSEEITSVGKEHVGHESERWMPEVDCPNCEYAYKASIW